MLVSGIGSHSVGQRVVEPHDPLAGVPPHAIGQPHLWQQGLQLGVCASLGVQAAAQMLGSAEWLSF